MLLNTGFGDNSNTDSKVHGANMGPTWVLSAPYGPHEPCYQGMHVLFTCGSLPDVTHLKYEKVWKLVHEQNWALALL